MFSVCHRQPDNTKAEPHSQAGIAKLARYKFTSFHLFSDVLGGPARYVHFLELAITYGGDRCFLPYYVNTARPNRKNRPTSSAKLTAIGEVQRSHGDLLSQAGMTVGDGIAKGLCSQSGDYLIEFYQTVLCVRQF